MELLAPAGNEEALRAAIACGADAVYLGYTAFGARSFAGNFDEKGLFDAVAYAHERGRKIYVTVNTLAKQKELPEVEAVLRLVRDSGADAVLVQDMGVLRLSAARFPELPLHASTQMTVCNAQGAEMLRGLGVRRVVPARECSLPELARIAETGVEVEAFAHGALCVAVSGQCLFSSMIGGRSGNRGRCAQPCRLPYALEDGTRGALLSPKDLMMLRRVPELMGAGVCSFKLEGRMKRPEYVAAVTLAYREAIDAAQAGQAYEPSEALVEGLRQIFNRGGFTEGYALRRSHAALMSWQRSNHNGVAMGRLSEVKNGLGTLTLERDLHDGDGLQLRGREDVEFTYSGRDMPAGDKAALRLPREAKARAGDTIVRLTDSRQMAALNARVKEGPEPIPVWARLTAIPGQPARLTLTDEQGHTGEAVGPVVSPARERTLDAETARERIARLGDTPYVLRALTLTGEGAFLPLGALNALRRDAAAALRAERLRRERQPVMAAPEAVKLPAMQPALLAVSDDPAEAEALLAAGADAFIWRLPTLLPEELDALLSGCAAERIAVELPAFTDTQTLAALRDWAEKHRERLLAVVVNNIGQAALPWPYTIWGGQGLNVLNAEAARFYVARGVTKLTASCELSAGELQGLFAEGGDYMLQAYGRMQLMLLSHCPVRTRLGDTARDDACRRCQGQPETYTDRKGYRFPLYRIRTAGGCLLRLVNSLPTDMAGHAQALHRLGCGYRLDFTDEPMERRVALTRSYRRLLDGGMPLHTPKDATAGHLMRGVE